MGVTLDAGSLTVYQKCLEQRSHPLKEHIATWMRNKILLSTPSAAWAEYWRGRGPNQHFIAKIRQYVTVNSVSQDTAEFAADALRRWPRHHNRNSVKHLIDSIVLAHANETGDVIYTTDVEDFKILWDYFPQVKALVSAISGEVIRKRY